MITWGEIQLTAISNVQDISSNSGAFAALNEDGSVQAWGDSDEGGDLTGEDQNFTTGVPGGELNNVQEIFSTNYAFAALKEDGSVVTWGDSDEGGDLNEELENVVTIASPFFEGERDPEVTPLEFDEDTFTFEVAELGNASDGDEVGTIEVSNPESDDLTLSFTEEVSEFDLDNDGNLTIAAVEELELGEFDFTVEAEDGLGNRSEAEVTVNIDSPAPEITPVEEASSVIETATDGTEIFTVEATDPDGDDEAINFAFNEDYPFAINDSGVVTVADSEALEADESFELEVLATDELGVESDPVTFEVEIDPDVNQPPTFTSSATAQVEENSTEVLSLEADDPEESAIALSLTGGTDQDLFTIKENNNLQFSNAPDFESPSDDNGDNVYQVQVTADDGNGGTTTQDLEITVTDVNETPSIPSSLVFQTPLSETRSGAEDTNLVRANPNSEDIGNSLVTETLTISNTGEGNLTLQEIQLPEIEGLNLTENPLTEGEATLSPEESVTATFNFSPTEAGIDLEGEQATIIYENDEVTVDLFGRSTYASDISYDGRVNLTDLGPLNASFGTSEGDENYDPTADINLDGRVNLTDLGLLSAEFGNAL